MAPRSSLQPLLVGALYFVGAALSVHYSRFNGGVAMIWLASAILAGRLSTMATARWAPYVACCMVASAAATGIYGLGWKIAVPMAAVNMAEAVAAAYIFRYISLTLWACEALEWIACYYLGIGLAVPLGSGLVATLMVWVILGGSWEQNMLYWLIGHGLGLMVFLPAAAVVCRRIDGRGRNFVLGDDRIASTVLLAAMTVLTTLVFLQDLRPLMLLPLLMALIGAVFAGPGVAMTLPVVVAVVGGFMTLTGRGPVAVMDLELGDKIQFFQLYLGVIVLTVLPIACEQARRRNQLGELRRSEARYRLLSDHATDLILHLDVNGIVRFVSPSVRQLWGCDPSQLLGSSVMAMVAVEHRDRVRDAHRKVIAIRGGGVRVEYRGVIGEAAQRWFETQMSVVLDDCGVAAGLVSITRDVTRRKRREDDLSRAALTDSLTGLPNRRAFLDRAAAMAEAGIPATLAIIDIDHFKQVNDRYGHAAGDAVLRDFARVALQNVRSMDTVARIGGEEFTVLIPHTDIEDARQICSRLTDAIARHVTSTDAGEITVTISTGIAALGESPLDALALADNALYRAKAQGRARLAVAA
jgi:diguanylate cyclase (GGDEF)-like protein/PAS domain S-box-containing protein